MRATQLNQTFYIIMLKETRQRNELPNGIRMLDNQKSKSDIYVFRAFCHAYILSRILSLQCRMTELREQRRKNLFILHDLEAVNCHAAGWLR